MRLETLRYSFKGLLYKVGREGPLFKKILKELDASQWYPEQMLADLKLKRLKALVRYAETHIPYYRALFRENGLSAESINSIDDLQHLPVMTKKAVLEKGRTLVTQGARRFFLSKASTSGTTGAPLELHRDYYSVNFEHATIHRHWRQAGYRFGDPFVTLRGNTLQGASGKNPVYWAFNRVHREMVMSSFHLSKKSLPRYIAQLLSFKPLYIYCYPQSLLTLLTFAVEAGANLKKLGVKGVFTSSEMVPARLHGLVQEHLGARIFDYYNTAERVLPIASCEHGTYHVQEEYGILELLPVDPAKNQYEIIGTGLVNRAMPLFRYQTRDIVELYPENYTCPCGRSFRCIKTIVGRPSECIIGSEGQEISGAGLTHIFYGVDTQVIESQIVQRSDGTVLIRIVPTERFTETNRSALEASFFHYTGICPAIEIVSAIHRTAAGKYQFIIRE